MRQNEKNRYKNRPCKRALTPTESTYSDKASYEWNQNCRMIN